MNPMEHHPKYTTDEDYVLKKQVDLVYANATSGMVGLLALTALFALLYWQHLPHNLLAGWITISLTATLWYAILIRRYHRNRTANIDTSYWARRFVFSSLAIGLVWGAATLLAMQNGSLMDQALATLLLGGLCAGVLANTAALPAAFMARVLPILPTLVIMQVSQNSAEYLFMGALTTLYSVVIFSAFQRHHQVLLESIQQQAEITEVMLALEESNRQLHISEARFRDLVMSSSDWIWETDSSGTYSYLSGQIEELTGYTQDELLHTDPLNLMCTDERTRILSLIQPLTSAREPIKELENWIHTRQGKRICLLTNATPIIDESGVFRGYRGVHKEITARKATEASMAEARSMAESANRAKGDFLATMSHEIRTPMNGVLGMVELLSDTELQREQVEYLGIIRQSGQALLGIINDILDFSKVEAGKMQLDPLPFDLEQATRDVVKLLQPKAQAGGLALILEYRPGCPRRLVGDAGRIRQILINLVNNALKFTEQGQVCISIEAREILPDRCTLQIEVQDTGIGINEADQQRLFEAFTQADSSTTRQYGGTGLGLAISRQFVELMHGKIGLHSTPGEGSTFWFELTLPLSASQAQPERTLQVRARPTFTAKALLAEDIAANQMVATSLLKRFGLCVDTVENGAEAVRQWQRETYDIIFMDCQMPQMDGYQAAAEIRALEQLNHTPIIALTANDRQFEQQQRLDSGMDDYLVKPFRREALAELLERWLPGETSQESIVADTTHHPAASSGDGSIDISRLDQVRDLMGDEFEQLIPAVTASISELLTSFPVAIEKQDRKEIRRLAHSIRSASANIGANRLSLLAADLESLATEIAPDQAHEQVIRLQTGFQQVRRDLDLLCG